ncbi:MAG: patatin-like phospholipase family protein [Candidatus Omnitrophica bacterium]|nr:patatin-like phospholipase family protein [Candidatus Omnitrophota bacterium]
MRNFQRVNQFCVITAAIFLVSGCASVRHAVPEKMLNDASISGMSNIRVYSGVPTEYFKKDMIGLVDAGGIGATYSMLAVSGGGANGAYGAGLLSGWTQSGTRPVFKVVTGISTGAIIAPFAFLGNKYDGELEEFYTKYSTKDIMNISIPFVNSFASPRPLKRRIEKYFDGRLLKEIASEYDKGRRLYVGTTNLDAQRLVIWDMGKIASIGDERALMLFRKVILASASIPIAFPPVYLKVQVGDKTYDEMHVDGGVAKQVFFLYDAVQGIEEAMKQKGIGIRNLRYKIYVIRNGYADAIWKEVPDRMSAIAERTVDTMVNAQGVGDIYQLYAFTELGKGDFNLAYIPATHVSKAKEPFDPIEMRGLFDLGFKEALQGYDWKKVPPGMMQ